jgi:hypothetical protein
MCAFITHHDWQVWDFLAAGESGHFEGIRHSTRCCDSGLSCHNFVGKIKLKRQQVFSVGRVT